MTRSLSRLPMPSRRAARSLRERGESAAARETERDEE
jgi:hypothetical protein